MAQTKRLGEILIESGIINEGQLENALHLQQENHKLLGQVLVEMGWVSEEAICQAVARVLNLDCVFVADALISQEIIRLLPEALATAQHVLPLWIQNHDLALAAEHAPDADLIRQIEEVTGLHVKPLIAPPIQLQQAITRHYHQERYLGFLLDHVQEEPLASEPQADASINDAPAEILEPPFWPEAARLMNLLIASGLRRRASSLAILRHAEGVSLSYMIDGVPTVEYPLPQWLQHPLRMALYALSGMGTSAEERSQHGSFQLADSHHTIEIQTSAQSTHDGELLKLSIRDPKTACHHLHRLGLSNEQQALCRHLLHQRGGWIFVTGPSGCGKHTTLYALLNALKGGDRKIVTLEYPVRYHLDGVEQFQINPQAERAFARGIQALLEQRPDVLLIGSASDPETAQLAVQAAASGILVLSPLTAPEAVATIYDLFQLKIAPDLVASTLLAAVAQRLVRRICPQCKIKHIPTDEEIQQLGLDDASSATLTCYRGEGCPACNYTGYYGQTGIYEIFAPDEFMRAEIQRPTPRTRLQELALETGLESLWEDGLKKIQQGITTIAEVLRVYAQTSQETVSALRARHAPSEAPPMQFTRAPRSFRILAASPDAATRAMLAGLLRQRGYEVLFANDSPEALHLIHLNPPALVILDSDLPRRNDVAVGAALRTQIDTLFLPVLMLTHHPSREESVQGVSCGVNHYLSLPFEPDDLLSRIEFIRSQYYRKSTDLPESS